MYELAFMRLKYIFRCGSPDIKHRLLKELERLRAEIEASPAEAASVNEVGREAKKRGSHE